MNDTNPAAAKQPSRLAQVVVGGIATLIGAAMLALALLGVYRAVTSPVPAGAGVLLLILFPLTLGAFLAWKGLAFVRGRTAEQPISLAPGEVRRRPVVAAVLSLVVPGVGQLYNGEVAKAAAFYLGALVNAALFLLGVTGRYFWGLVVTLALTLLLLLWTVIDAAVVARRRRIVPAHRFSRWLVLAPVAIALALLSSLLLRVQVVKSFYLPSSSMEPTIKLNDRVIADLSYYRHRPLTVGTLAMFHSPDDPAVLVVKRVVAVAGDRVEIRDKQLLVNGERVDEPWAVHRDSMTGRAGPRRERDNLAPMVVPPGCFFALGDNRDESFDSRFFGPVPLANLEGKVLFVYWSEDRGRIGRSL